MFICLAKRDLLKVIKRVFEKFENCSKKETTMLYNSRCVHFSDVVRRQQIHYGFRDGERDARS